MWTVLLLTCSQAFNKKKKKDKVQVPQQDEMKFINCTALGFIGENKMYRTVGIWKSLYYKKLLSNIK